MEILLIALFLVLIIGGAIYGHYRSEQRKQALAEFARQHGWQFSPDTQRDVESRYAAFSCLQQGSDRYAYNIFEGQAAERDICGFDYHYATHSTDSKGRRTTHHHYFSAIVVEVPLDLKPLVIRPEGFFDKITELLGFDDIDFELAEFSRKFCVKADDRRWAYDIIQQSTMEFLLHAPQFTIQLAGHHVMAYRAQLFDPADFEQALEVIGGVVDRLPGYLIRELKGVEK